MSYQHTYVWYDTISQLWAGSPFDAEASRAESTLALLAGGALHPTPAVRESCRRTVNEQIGVAEMDAEHKKVRAGLSQYSEDLLDPLVLEDGDHWLVAALQLLRPQRLPKDQTALRVTSLDAFGVSGGVNLSLSGSSERVPRRTGNGGWSIAQESAYHPTLLRAWVAETARPRCTRIEVAVDPEGIRIKIPHKASGADRLYEMMDHGLQFPAPKWFEQWLLAGHARPPSQPSTPGAGHPRLSLISGAQQYSRLTADAVLLSAMGGHVTGTDSAMRIQIKKPEAIIRFSAMALKPGLIEIAGNRPLGWLVLGRGDEEIDFVRAMNATPPYWLQYVNLPRLSTPTELVRPLAEWIGPCVGVADFTLLEVLRG